MPAAARPKSKLFTSEVGTFDVRCIVFLRREVGGGGEAKLNGLTVFNTCIHNLVFSTFLIHVLLFSVCN